MRTSQSLLCLALAAIFISTALADMPSDADCKSADFSMGQDAMWVRLLLCLDPVSELSAAWTKPESPYPAKPLPSRLLNADPGHSKLACPCPPPLSLSMACLTQPKEAGTMSGRSHARLLQCSELGGGVGGEEEG